MWCNVLSYRDNANKKCFLAIYAIVHSPHYQTVINPPGNVAYQPFEVIGYKLEFGTFHKDRPSYLTS